MPPQIEPVLAGWIVLAGIEVLIVLCVLLAKRPIVAVIGVLISVISHAFALQPPHITMGVTIYLPDILFTAMFIIAALHWRSLIEASWSGYLLVGLALLFAVNLLRGIESYGLQTAVNASRSYFYFLAGAVYFSSRRLSYSTAISILKQWVTFGLLSAIVAMFFWITMFMSLYGPSVWSRQAELWGNSPLRVLSVQHAMYLSSALFVALGFHLRSTDPAFQRRTSIVLLITLFLLTHRTVWIVVIVGLLTLFLLSSRMRTRYSFITPLLVLLSGALVFGLSGSGSAAWVAERAPTNVGTVLWRVESTQALIQDFKLRDIVERLFGQAFGTGYHREVAGAGVDLQPHNFYVETLISLGVIGLVLLASLYASVLREAFAMAAAEATLSPLLPQIAFVLVLGQLVFFLTYGVTLETGSLLGLIMGIQRSVKSHVHHGGIGFDSASRYSLPKRVRLQPGS